MSDSHITIFSQKEDTTSSQYTLAISSEYSLGHKNAREGMQSKPLHT